MKDKHPRKPATGRRRSTGPVLSHRAYPDRWWSSAKAPMVRGVISKTRHISLFDLGDQSPRLRCLIVICSVLAPLLTLVCNPAMHNWWRSLNPTAIAEEQIAKGRFSPDADEIFIAACRQNPDKPNLLRALAGIVAESDPALARRCYNRIDELQSSTDEDHAHHATILAKFGDFTGASAVLYRMSPLAERSIGPLRAQLTLGVLVGSSTIIDKSTRSMNQWCPDEVESYLQAAALAHDKSQLALANQLELQAVQQLARWASQGRSAEITKLVPQVLSLPLLESETRQQAAQVLRTLRTLPIEQTMAAIYLSYPAGTSCRDNASLLQDCQQQILASGGLSVMHKDALASFFQQRGEHEQVIHLIAPAESYSDRLLFKRRTDSLLHLGQWREASSLLIAPGAPASTQPHSLSRLLITLGKRSANTPVTSVLLDQAITEAQSEKNSLACYTVGCIAMESQMPDLATEAFAKALTFAAKPAQMEESVINTARRTGMSLSAVLQIYNIAGLTTSPDENTQQRLCYLRLLSGQPHESDLSYLQTRLADRPGQPYLRFLEALKNHQRGDYTEAARLLVPLPQYRWQQGEAAVIAAMIASIGMLEQSSSIINAINDSEIFAEERSMVTPWKVQLDEQKRLLGSNQN